MAQPKKKTSKSKRDMRRSHWYKMDLPNMVPCSHCGNIIQAHQACPACGMYKGREVIKIKAPKTKQEKEDKKENKASKEKKEKKAKSAPKPETKAKKAKKEKKS
jgi:large subunit ribosomal protein L32